jgi:hypothetical protein
MTKSFSVAEKGRLTVFAGFNNVLNNPRWPFPDANAFSTTFGVVNGQTANVVNGSTVNTLTGNRTINLRATLSF